MTYKIILLLIFVTGPCYSSEIFIRIFKQQKTLEIWEKDKDEFKLFRRFPICYFSGKLGPKEREGDRQAPEGVYSITKKSLNPYSRYHLSFNIGYPNKLDQALGRTGDLIMVHGSCVSVGCFAMTDKSIEQIYNKVEIALIRQKRIFIHIFPFPLTKLRRFVYRWHKDSHFWESLYPVYNYFEKHKKVPEVKVKNKQYVMKSEKY